MDYDSLIKSHIEKLDNSPKISNNNKEITYDFVKNYCYQKELAPQSTLKYYFTLTQVVELLGKDFKDILEDPPAINELLYTLQTMNIASKIKVFGKEKKAPKERDYSKSSIYGFKKVLKTFLKWVKWWKTLSLLY